MATKLKKSSKSSNQRKVVITPSLTTAKQYLQKNDIREIAKECGIGPSQASLVMSGKSTNWEFAKKIIERAEFNKTLMVRAEAL